MTYQAVFEQADDGSVFVYVPDLPGCTAGARHWMKLASMCVRRFVVAVRRAGEWERRSCASTIASAPIEVDAA